MADHKKWLATIRQQVTDHHSRARDVWNGLTKERRGVVLHAAGLGGRYCSYSWSEFDNRELLRLKRGIQRLDALVNAFGAIGDLDFVQPVKPAKPSVLKPNGDTGKASDVVQAILEARATLRNNVAERRH